MKAIVFNQDGKESIGEKGEDKNKSGNINRETIN